MCSVVTAIIVGCTAVSAQTSDQRRAETAAQAGGAAGEITLVGCLQREADYRRQQDSGRGGVAGTGLGRGNEYILVNAMRMGSTPVESDLDCGTIGATSGAPGEAYELTGEAEPTLEAYVGRKVAVTGRLKDADTEPIGTSGSTVTTPSGGFDPLGQDLKLFELNVTSFAEVTAPAPAAAEPSAAAATTTSEAQTETAAMPQQASATVGRELPRTASPLPIAGMLGLLSLGGAIAVRRFRR
jgi:hypothetical protein